MNYDNYEEKVIQRLKVKLVGWPFEKVVSPAKLYTIGELRTLRDALRSGACARFGCPTKNQIAHRWYGGKKERGWGGWKDQEGKVRQGMKTGPRCKPGAYEESGDEGGSDTDDACPGVPTSTPAEQPAIFSEWPHWGSLKQDHRKSRQC